MSRTWLLFDTPYLCHRAHHSMGFLQYKGTPTGVIFGLLRDVKYLTTLHNTQTVMFAFDSHKSHRQTACPTYKAHRRHRYESSTPEQKLERSQLQGQITDLKDNILPQIGFRNICLAEHYEADDVIASFLITLPKEDKAIIVSGDQDLYQLLRGDRVVMWKPQPGKVYTEYSLAKDYYGIAPEAWIHVKAIAGCTTDGVAGVPGVGDLTAAKYLKHKCAKNSKAFQAVKQFTELWTNNIPLVQLPYAGCPMFQPQEDMVTDKGWRDVLKRYGIRSLDGPTSKSRN